MALTDEERRRFDDIVARIVDAPGRGSRRSGRGALLIPGVLAVLAFLGTFLVGSRVWQLVLCAVTWAALACWAALVLGPVVDHDR